MLYFNKITRGSTLPIFVGIDFLDDSQVDLLPWPPRSPDISPIEHLWDLMGRRLTNLHNPSMTLATLKHEIQVAWDSVPQEEINHLIRSIPRSV
jgi:transposase